MRVLFTNIAVVLVLSVCSNALAVENVDALAEAAFREGIKHFKANQYNEAAAAFRKAYELKSNWKLLYNVGQSEAAAKKNGLALETFERYLTEGGDDIPEARYEEVRKEVKRLRDVVGSLEIKVPDGATVFVDDVNRGQTPLPGLVMVASGVVHKVVVTQGQKDILTRSVRVSGGKTFVVTADASPEPAIVSVPAPVVEKPEAEEPGSALKAWGWVTFSIGGAILVGGAVTGGVTLAADKDIDSKCPDGCYSRYYDEMDRRDNLALTTDILLGIGGAVTLAGVVMLIVAASRGEDDEGSVSMLPLVGPQIAGATLEWRF